MFVRPFLSEEQYLSMIDSMFKKDVQRGLTRPGQQMRIYLNDWTCPAAIDPDALSIDAVAPQNMLLFDPDTAPKGDDVECSLSL